jgi:membrane protease YdiL (CAAX protease family)
MEDNLLDSKTQPVQTQSYQKIPYSTISSGFGLFGLFIAISLACAIPLGILQKLLDPKFKSLLGFLGYTLSMVLILLITIKERKSFSFSWKAIPISVIALSLIVVLSMGMLVEPFVNIIPMPDSIAKLFKDMISIDVFGFFMVVIAAPILEEVVFRGVLLEGMLKRYSPIKAIFWSAFIFGLVHLNPWQFIGALAIGMFIGWVYWKTGSLWPCILMHFANNLVGFIMMYYTKNITEITFGNISNNIVLLCIYIGCVPVFIVGYLMLKRIFMTRHDSHES